MHGHDSAHTCTAFQEGLSETAVSLHCTYRSIETYTYELRLDISIQSAQHPDPITYSDKATIHPYMQQLICTVRDRVSLFFGYSVCHVTNSNILLLRRCPRTEVLHQSTSIQVELIAFKFSFEQT